MTKGFSTCVNCGKMIKTQDAKILHKKKYCPDCAIKLNINTDTEDYDKLVSYITQLCHNQPGVKGLILSQIKKLVNMEGCGYTYKGILNTLTYVFELSEEPPQLSYIYGIEKLVIRYYYEASKYYDMCNHAYAQDVNTLQEILTKPPVEMYVDIEGSRRRRDELLHELKLKMYGEPFDLNDIPDEEE